MKKLFTLIAVAALSLASPAFAQLKGQLVAGSDSGIVRNLNVDPTGRLYVVGSATGGSVYGNNASGTAPTQPPVFIAGWDGTLVRSLSTDTNGRLNVNNISGTISLPTGAATEATLSTVNTSIGTVNTSIGTMSAKLPASLGAKTGANSFSVVPASDGFAVNQGGTWNINNVSGTISLPTGAATAAKQPALGTAGTPSADVISVQGVTGGTAQAAFIEPTTSATYSLTPTVSTAVGSSIVAKVSAGNLYGVSITTGASAGYLLMFNATASPADGAVTPLMCRTVPANSSLEIDHSVIPDRFTTGITAVFSTTGCFTKTASATAMFEVRFK
jgi:hypothetical protein